MSTAERSDGRDGRGHFAPAGSDRFDSQFGQIQFERDSAETVTRMLASSGRVRNLRFKRVDW